MRVRNRFLLAATLSLGAVLATGYAFAPGLLAFVAKQGLGNSIGLEALVIEALGPGEAVLSRARVRNERLSLDARDLVVRFDLWPFRVLGVHVKHAELSLPRDGARVGAAGVPPAAPPFPIRVDELLLRAETPWGTLSLPASIAARPGPAAGIEAMIRTPGLSALLANPAEGEQILEIYNAAGAPLLHLRTKVGDGYPIPFSGHLDPTALGHWLHDSELVPAELKGLVAPFAVTGDRLELAGRLMPGFSLEALLHGHLAVRDLRGPDDRLFESIALKSQRPYAINRSLGQWSGTGAAELALSLGPETTLSGSDPTWRWDGAGLNVRFAQLRAPGLGVTAQSLEADTSTIRTDATNGGIRLAGLAFAGWPEALAQYDVEGNWSWRNASFQANGLGQGAALRGLSWQLQAARDHGHLEIDVREPVASLAPIVEDFIGGLAKDLEIRDGDLEGQYRLGWAGGRQQVRLRVQIGPVDARLDAMEVRGLAIRMRNRGDDLEPLTVGIRAPALELAAGTMAEDVVSELRVSRSQLRIDKARARLLGGLIALRPASIRLPANHLELITDLEGLSAEQLIALLKMESLELTGALSGELRLLYSRTDGITTEGDLYGIRPGILRLRLSREAADDGRFEALAMRALEDFRYNELSAKLRYRPNGEYRIAARIVGHNPDVFDGHPIALNPTIEGRLPTLFSALFVTGDFNRALLQGLNGGSGSLDIGETPGPRPD